MKELIWKFELKVTEKVTDGFPIRVDLPQTAEILSTGAVGDQMFIWAKFSEEAKDLDRVPRYFEVFGTGHDIHCDIGVDRKFIGTAFMYNGSLVWHVFERLN